jgi:hypothetical protein
MTWLWTGHENVTDEQMAGDGQTEPITISPFFLQKGGGQLAEEYLIRSHITCIIHC